MMYNLMSIVVLLATLLFTPKPPSIDVAKVVSHPVQDNVVAAFMVKGTVTLRIGARAAAGDQHSEMVYHECTVAVRN